MKRSVLLIIVLLLISRYATALDIITKDIDKLPQAAKAYVTQHFPNDIVSYIEIDREIIQTTYEVVFTNGSKIEFNGSGEWKEINCKRSAVPMSIIPPMIVDYLNRHFENVSVVKIEKEKKKYELTYDRSPISSDILPTEVLNVLNYGIVNIPVIKTLKDGVLYEVELSNGLELFLSSDGQLFKIDD